MNPFSSEIVPGEGFRQLRTGERILSTDEYFDGHGWCSREGCSCVGEKYTWGERHVFTRRKIEQMAPRKMFRIGPNKFIRVDQIVYCELGNSRGDEWRIHLQTRDACYVSEPGGEEWAHCELAALVSLIEGID